MERRQNIVILLKVVPRTIGDITYPILYRTLLDYKTFPLASCHFVASVLKKQSVRIEEGIAL